MDDDNAELIALLCARVCMIMEDASVVALTIGHSGAEDRRARLAVLQQVAGQISALIGAATALLDQTAPSDPGD